MDVRCEKCGTEYELDESRLKPGGVTVKCTHCDHMFKIRKRPVVPDVPGTMTGMPKPPPPAAPAAPSAAPKKNAPPPAPGAPGERHWLIRLENGETRSCRELAALQQWIIAGEVTRDALISRSGKTWKTLGDIVELGTYFAIAEEARNQRAKRESMKPTTKKPEDSRTTLVGVGAVASGSMALGDLDDIDDAAAGENDPTLARRISGVSSRTAPMHTAADDAHARSTAPHPASTEPPTVPVGVLSARDVAAAAEPPTVPAQAALASLAKSMMAPTTLPGAAAPVPSTPKQQVAPAPSASSSGSMGASEAARPAPASPPPEAAPVAAAAASQPIATPALAPPTTGPMVTAPGIGALPALAAPGSALSPSPAAGQATGQATGQASMPWTGGLATAAPAKSGGPEGPMMGRFSGAATDEPAFAGGRPPRGPSSGSVPFTGIAREPSASTTFPPDDDRGPKIAPRGSRAGLWIAIVSILIIAGGVATVWLTVLRPRESGGGGSGDTRDPVGSGSAVAVVSVDAAPPAIDATAPAPDAAGPVDAAAEASDIAAELTANVEARMKGALTRLGEGPTKDEPATLAMRARLLLALAQAQQDRAELLPASDRAAADKLRQAAKAAVLEALPLAQRAQKLAPAKAATSLAMADLLRLQGKPSREVRRYLEAANADAAAPYEQALIEGLLLIREGKLADARALLSRADAADGKLEKTGDVRVRFRVAMAALADGKTEEARAALDSVIAAQPEHEGAKALRERLDRTVTNTDPLPPEEGTDPSERDMPGAGDSFAKLVAKADKLASDGSCTRAIPLYEAALVKTPNGLPALIGLGFCFIDTKQFSSANSKFRTVLSMDSRNERALWGIAQLYQEQDNKPKAIQAYRDYLEAFPGNAAAKRQLERLGAPVDEGGGTPPPAPPPSDPTPAAPSPAPAPAPEEPKPQ